MSEGGSDWVVRNDDGQLVRYGSGDVIGPVIEGTQDYPARPVRGEDPPPRRGGTYVIGVRQRGGDPLLEFLIPKVEEVLMRHGVRFHRSQVEELARRLRGVGRVQRVAEVLDCVLDVNCQRYNVGVRKAVKSAFESVFGRGSVTKVQIANALGILGVNVSVDEVFDEYNRLEEKVRLLGRSVYKSTLVWAAIARALARRVGFERAVRYMNRLGRAGAIELLRELGDGNA